MRRCWTVVTAIMLLSACATHPPPIRPRETLNVSGKNPTPYLNVSIAAFTNKGLGKGGQSRIYAPVREAEASYLPVLLRNKLNDSGHWGAVRVSPLPNPSAEVQVTASILKSTALELELHVNVKDSRGIDWLDKTYDIKARPADYAGNIGDDALQSVFNQVANDMYRARLALSQKDAKNLLRASKLRFAILLSPQSFSGYLAKGRNGVAHVVEMPASNDKMYARVTKIRAAEYKFEDIMNEEYSAFYRKLRTIYPIWQSDSYGLLSYNKHINKTGSKFDVKEDPNSWQATVNVYDTFKEYRLNDDELRELASTFKSETKPNSVAFEGRVVKLQGPLEDQYRQWRKILAGIYSAERPQPDKAGSK